MIQSSRPLGLGCISSTFLHLACTKNSSRTSVAYCSGTCGSYAMALALRLQRAGLFVSSTIRKIRPRRLEGGGRREENEQNECNRMQRQCVHLRRIEDRDLVCKFSCVELVSCILTTVCSIQNRLKITPYPHVLRAKYESRHRRLSTLVVRTFGRHLLDERRPGGPCHYGRLNRTHARSC